MKVKPEDLHHYPPKIVCRFVPTSKAPKETSCTLNLLGLDEPVSASIPLFSPKRDVDASSLKVSGLSKPHCMLKELGYFMNL